MSGPTYAWHIGDTRRVLATMAPGSVSCVITSPPYLRQREYLPADHPDKALEMGREHTPAEFLDGLLETMDLIWDVLTDDGTFWINLGDKHAGSGGAGGDYNDGGLRAGQPKFGKAGGNGWPLDQSVCWTPQLLGASLAYGRNLLNGQPHRQWITRPPVTWCKPSPPVGRLVRTFRSATELIIYGGKHQAHHFDLDAVRYEPPPEHERKTYNQRGPKQKAALAAGRAVAGHVRYTQRTVNPKGAPPLNWWVVPSRSTHEGDHFATYPVELLTLPILCGCPAHGTVLDPWAGSGTTLEAALGHGRSAVGIDLDPRNLDLAQQRLGMFPLDVHDHRTTTEVAS